MNTDRSWGGGVICKQRNTKIFQKYLNMNSQFNPIVVGLFDSPILVGGGQKRPPTELLTGNR